MKNYLVVTSSLLALSLAACAQQDPTSNAEDADNLLVDDWQQVSELAAGQKVNIYMWEVAKTSIATLTSGSLLV
ncbi:hypothetical protein [Planococcus faecalis]|uniref:hypothetical protein n=1 Tax=Planococcus faecalis TaxID=1598147 RepID=UPI00210F00A0|nr:hypothetical protein [Planococcus faecalis]